MTSWEASRLIVASILRSDRRSALTTVGVKGHSDYSIAALPTLSLAAGLMPAVLMLAPGGGALAGATAYVITMSSLLTMAFPEGFLSPRDRALLLRLAPPRLVAAAETVHAFTVAATVGVPLAIMPAFAEWRASGTASALWLVVVLTIASANVTLTFSMIMQRLTRSGSRIPPGLAALLAVGLVGTLAIGVGHQRFVSSLARLQAPATNAVRATAPMYGFEAELVVMLTGMLLLAALGRQHVRAARRWQQEAFASGRRQSILSRAAIAVATSTRLRRVPELGLLCGLLPLVAIRSWPVSLGFWSVAALGLMSAPIRVPVSGSLLLPVHSVAIAAAAATTLLAARHHQGRLRASDIFGVRAGPFAMAGVLVSTVVIVLCLGLPLWLVNGVGPAGARIAAGFLQVHAVQLAIQLARPQDPFSVPLDRASRTAAGLSALLIGYLVTLLLAQAEANITTLAGPAGVVAALGALSATLRIPVAINAAKQLRYSQEEWA